MNKTIHELNSLAQAQADDEFIIYDVSEGESKKIQVQNLTNPNYSTTEQKTGGTWIDGKPIYRKVIEITETLVSPSGGFTLSIPITETPNIERVLKSTLIGRRETSEQRFMMSGGDALVAPSTSKIMFHSTADIYVSKVIVEYTKTTD